MQTNKISEVSSTYTRQYLEQAVDPIDPNRPLPFEDFYLSFLIDARQRLNRRLADRQLELLSLTAYRSLERNLLERLVSLGTKTLAIEFDRYREEYTSLDKTTESASQSRALYDDFRAEKIALFERYSVLSDLIAKTIELWVDSTQEFIQRLDVDLPALALTFAEGSSLGKLQDINTALSDRHHGGRSVFGLTFSHGIEIVYKPKDLSLDVAFDRLLMWCNHQNILLPFRSLKILDRQGYGWQEFVRQQPCIDQSAVQNFYYRSGMMLSLLFMLGAKDCEHQNVIASGEYSLLIDADSLLCPDLTGADEENQWFDDSVLRSGFLPRWNGDDFTAHALDSSVLGNIFPKQTNSAREWQSINTDEMHLVPKTIVIPAGKNAVILDRKTISPQSYLDEIVKGFQEMSQLFIDHRETLLSKESPLSALAKCKSRFHLRPAITYGAMLDHALHPQSLSEHSEYSVLINRLLHHRVPNAIETSELSVSAQIFQAEVHALQQQDIPYCSICCNSIDLEIEPSKIIPHFVDTPGYQQAIKKIRNFNPEKLALQVKLIRSSFAAKYAHLVRNDTAIQGDLPLTHDLSAKRLQQEALEIGRDLVDNAIWDGAGCNWIEFSYMFRAHRYRLDVLDDSLYTGRAGVSIFLAALAKLSGDRQFHEVALGALDPFRHSILAGENRAEILESKFGLLGLGGTIYSLVKVSQFLQESSLLDDAVQAAKLLTPDAIATDQKLDVIWGATGAILGLLSLYQATQDRSVLDIAVACGNHLLATRTTTKPRAWVTMAGESTRPLTGFSHGVAGIVMALIRLYGATGDREFLVAAQEGMEYERSVFNETVQNWPDFRMAEQSGKIDYLDVWCHGSAGIGLARLGSWSVIPEPEIFQDINISLSTSQNNGIFHRGFDHLCCGNVGRIELMVAGSQLLGDRQLLATARESIEKMVITSKESSTYGLLPHMPDAIFSPSFYRGVAGIGYQILRTINPESIPPVVLWK
ncbi:MAG: type 2 lantipeptide synthetase LanM [Cyanobacteriota bacterium]|jgi:type 2 lantibiotic biosynthesis protein LanM